MWYLIYIYNHTTIYYNNILWCVTFGIFLNFKSPDSLKREKADLALVGFEPKISWSGDKDINIKQVATLNL